MKKTSNKQILVLLISLLVLCGCGPSFGGFISESINPGSYCDLRYTRGMKRLFFHEAKISGDPEKAVIVLYRPFVKRCGGGRDIEESKIVIFIDDKQAVDHLVDDHFTALRVDPKKLGFSAKTVGGLWGHGGKMELSPQAGKTYFIRWSTSGKHGYNSFSRGDNVIQLVEEKKARTELEGVMYLAPQAFKAPVFDKKTGKPL